MLEVGKKYTNGVRGIEVKFVDPDGTAWGLDKRGYCTYVLVVDMSKFTEEIKIEQPKYVPYTWEDRDYLRGKWFINKTSKREYQVTKFSHEQSGALMIVSWRAEVFLRDYVWLDGTPCGKKVE